MADVNEVLREFDAVEANLRKLETIWDRMEKLIPDGIAFMGNSPEGIGYEEDARAFKRILDAMPAIDSRRLEYAIMDLDAIAQARIDAQEIGEIECHVGVERSVTEQSAHLREYRSRFDHQRRGFTRGHLVEAIKRVDTLLAEIAAGPELKPGDLMRHAAWETLKNTIDQIDVLVGSTHGRGTRWPALRRHLSFGMWQDFKDIQTMDWPDVKRAIEDGMFGKDEPLPVSVTDLNALAAARASGPVATRLKWESLSDDDFERLTYVLISSTKGYANTDWLMKTNAPDRGRDICTWRIVDDPLVGSRRFRVLVQCKHWLTKSIGVAEVAKLKEQVTLWEPPPIDELIIATSGRFAQDAVQLVEKHNEARARPTMIMWPESHLEQILAARPDIVAEFRLR